MPQHASDPGTDRYVVCPEIDAVEIAAGVAGRIYNPRHGKEADLEAEHVPLVSLVLRSFSTPRSLSGFMAEHEELPVELLWTLIDTHFLVLESELPFLGSGFVEPAQDPIGPLCSWEELAAECREAPREGEPAEGWLVVGVPVDVGAFGRAGARHGPAEIRHAFSPKLLASDRDLIDFDFRRRYLGCRPHVLDLGNIDRGGSSLELMGRRLQKAVGGALDRGMRPLVLGGDHSITRYVLEVMAGRFPRFGILHFDAHHDLHAATVLTHANVFYFVLDHPEVSHLVQIGLRGLERTPPRTRPAHDPRLSIISARQIHQGNAMAALDALPADVPWYLSFDVDCMDVSIASETGTPRVGGLTYYQALELVDHITGRFRLLGADFVEVAGGERRPNGAASVVAQLMARCLLSGHHHEPLDGHLYRSRV
jgi:arginase family enzyme